MQKSLEQKLNDIDTRIRRWQPRFTRASNELNRLLKMRRKLTSQQAIAGMTAPPGQPTPNQIAAIRLHEKEPSLSLPQAEAMVQVASLDIPDFMRRGAAAQEAVDKIIEETGVDPQRKIDPRTAKRLAKNDERRRTSRLSPLVAKAMKRRDDLERRAKK